MADVIGVTDANLLKAIAPEATEAEIERRRSSREPLGTVGMLTADNDEGSNPIQVLVTNVSVHGVGFRSPVSFTEGAVYRIRIGTGPLQLTSRMRITDARRRADGTCDVGAEFC